MQYELQVFHDEDRNELRTMEIDGEPWFVLADVCRRLEIGNPSDAARRLDADEKGVAQIDTLGGRQAATIINESGLYSVILRSEKPGAKRFKKWITSEVLPSIRRLGSYAGRAAQIPAEWQPFLDRVATLNGAVPEGFFSIFEEMASLVKSMVVAGVPVDHKTIPDIPIGKAWSAYWQERGYDEEFGGRIHYPHSYPSSFPQAASNPQWAFAYPETAVGEFRRWFRTNYLKQNLPRYLRNKANQGAISHAVADTALVAVGALPPPERPPLKLPR